MSIWDGATEHLHPIDQAGCLLIYYNYWNNWSDEQQCISQSLIRWTEHRDPEPGELFWMKEDPLHPQGKVYGYRLHRVQQVDTESVHHQSGYCSRAHFFQQARLIAAEARPRLLDFVARNPSALEL